MTVELPVVELGQSGLKVTELCFGTLTMSPLQADLSPESGGGILKKAIDEGVNFIDAAQGYRNYAHVRAGIQCFPRDRLVIATKSHARTGEEMQKAFEQACDEMGISYVDIFHLHLVSSPEDFASRIGALERLKELKAEGLVKAVGLSAHTIAPFRNLIGGTDIDICYPAFNKVGLGINDGTLDEMCEVLSELHKEGKGIYAMKPLGGGNLSSVFEEALEFVRGFEFIDAISIGMKDERELALNLAFFRGEEITGEMRKSASEVKRALHVNRLCKKCGRCVEVCEQGAMSLGPDRAEVDESKCIYCGYCAPECPVFAIRIV